MKSIDYDILKAVRIMTSSLEVSVYTTREWERTILLGYKTWKKVEENQGEKVSLDLDNAEIRYV